jgi:hypothetical protein
MWADCNHFRLQARFGTRTHVYMADWIRNHVISFLYKWKHWREFREFISYSYCLNNNSNLWFFLMKSKVVPLLNWLKVFFFLICILGGGVQPGSTRHVGHLLAYCTCPGWFWGWRIWWNEWQGKPKYSEKTFPDATLSTTNSTWPDPELNPGRRGGKPANWLSLRREGVWGSGCIGPHFLDLGTSWELYPRERAPCTRWIGGWVIPRRGLDDVEKSKLLTLPGLELRPLGRPARSQSLYRLSYPGSNSWICKEENYSKIGEDTFAVKWRQLI